MSGNPEYIRGVGIGWQTTLDTPAAIDATHGAWPLYWTRCDITEDPTFDIPKFLDYSLWREIVANPATRVGKLHIEGYLDAYFTGWLLGSMMGTPTGTGPYVFKGGTLGAPPLTVVKVNPLLTTYDQLYNAVLTKLEFKVDPASGRITYTADGLGAMPATLPTSPPTPTYQAAPPSFAPWQHKASVDGTGYKLISGTYTYDKTVEALYETPAALPGAGAAAGLSPSEFEVQEAMGSFDVVSRFTVYAASLFAKLRTNTAFAFNVEVQDPNATGTPDILFEHPVAKGTGGSLDDAKARARQHVTGHFLRDATLASGVRVTVTPGGSSLPAYATS